MESKKHFVLVHGACHGAWCWYKLVALLKSAGYKVTALDLGASGVNPKQLDDLVSVSDYVQPLLEFMATLPEDERIILVGHSYGGLSLSLAMEKFPDKVLVAVFVTAYMPNHTASPAFQAQQYFKRTPIEDLLDCKIAFNNGLEGPPTSASFGPLFLSKLYQNCSSEDLELAKMLVRAHGFFLEDLDKESLLTEAKYGSVNRAFVVCDKDTFTKEEFQHWIIENSPPKQVKHISEAAHMVMLSNPKELKQCLLEIAEIYQ